MHYPIPGALPVTLLLVDSLLLLVLRYEVAHPHCGPPGGGATKRLLRAVIRKRGKRRTPIVIAG
jgi:hypothetical protein